MHSRGIFWALFNFLYFINGGITETVRFHSDQWHRGREITLNFTDCADLPYHFDNNAVSVNTHGMCIRLYDEEGCLGSKYLDVKPSSTSHGDLGVFNFSRITSSVGICDECSKTTIAQLKTKSNETTQVTFYSAEKFTGTSYTIGNITGCTIFPIELKSMKIMSVKTDGKCYELHTNWDCTGHIRELSKLNQHQHSSFALLEFITTISSISPCQFRCLNETVESYNKLAGRRENLVTIYSLPHNKGHYEHVKVDKCVTVPKIWTGKMQSLRTYECIRIFLGLGCIPEYFFTELSFAFDIKNFELYNRTYSFAPCPVTHEDVTPKYIETSTLSSVPVPFQEDLKNKESNTVSKIFLIFFLIGVCSVLVAGIFILYKKQPWNNNRGISYESGDSWNNF